MALNDSLSDMLARIKNAQVRNHSKVSLPSSKFKVKIADVLKNEGYINNFNVENNDNKNTLIIDLKYNSGSPVITVIESFNPFVTASFVKLFLDQRFLLEDPTVTKCGCRFPSAKSCTSGKRPSVKM